jgi:hypothetical protein
LPRLDDNTPRVDEERDIIALEPSERAQHELHARKASRTGQHFLYIEATDNNGLASLGVVEIVMVAPSFEHDLLIVDDTRLEPDKFKFGVLEAYKAPWPSSAELDTFLYARGGAPWRQTKDPESGVTSFPGVFAGYRFDHARDRGSASRIRSTPCGSRDSRSTSTSCGWSTARPRAETSTSWATCRCRRSAT